MARKKTLREISIIRRRERLFSPIEEHIKKYPGNVPVLKSDVPAISTVNKQTQAMARGKLRL